MRQDKHNACSVFFDLTIYLYPMKYATPDDKPLVVDLLSSSFIDNKSVNYIISQDQSKDQRVRALMDYSFEICYLFGEVFLSDDRTACALLLYQEKKHTTLKSIWLDLKLILTCIGLWNIFRAIKRELKSF